MTGPAGSGKTHAVLSLFCERPSDALLIVPTVSFREHTRNSLLRLMAERDPAAILTGRRVVTFNELAPEPVRLSGARRELLVRRLLREIDLPYFRGVADFAGFRETLADEADEALAAGLHARDVARAITGDDLRSRAFLDFLRAYEKVAAPAPPPVISAAPALLLVDGFTGFTHRQRLALQQLVNGAAESTVTLPESSETARQELVRDMGFSEERLEGNHRGHPVTVAFACHDRYEELELVAREIAELVGRHDYHFRDIGIIVQTPDAYLRPLAALLEEWSIPARLFFPIAAAETSMGRHLLACLRLLDEEDAGAAAFEILKSPWYRLCHRSAVNRSEFQLAAGQHPRETQEFFTTVERLRRERPTKPRDLARWVLRAWETFTEKGEIEVEDHSRAAKLRADAETLRRALELPGEIANAIEAERGSPEEFLALLTSELCSLRFRVRDRRHDAVNVMNAYEARQWEMRAVFLVGAVEGEFPRPSRASLFLSASERLAASLPTVVDDAREQRHLYDVAVTRARERLTITWPRTNGRSDLIPSRFVADMPFENAVSPEPRPRSAPIAAEALLETTLVRDRIRESQTVFSASKFQLFAQCPFKHFARYLLHLEGRPAQEKGITPDLAGKIVHAAIAEWERSGEDIAAIFERVFAEQTRGIPLDHSDDARRARMVEDLRAFVENSRSWPQTYRTRLDPRFVEHKFRFPLALDNQDGGEQIELEGRFDRVETVESPGGPIGLAVDFKYKAKFFTRAQVEKIRNGEEYQIPLYLMALAQLGLRPGGLELYNLRGDTRRAGVIDESLKNQLMAPGKYKGVSVAVAEIAAAGREHMIEAAQDMRRGVISIEPLDPERCKKTAYGCEFYDVCRINKWQH